MKLSILMVNYNTEAFIADFLHDLVQQPLSTQDYEIIITNNVQNNALAEMIQANQFEQKLNIQIIQSNQNIGFGRAMNLAAQIATGKHFLIANPDLRIQQSHFLQELLTQAEHQQHYGLISTQILSDKAGYKTEYLSYEFNQDLGYPNQVCWISGALLLIRSEIFQQLAGFDPDFFMYCEDEDLSYRVKQLNLPLITLSELQVYHYGGASEPNQSYDFYYRWYRSRLLFAYKHFSQDTFEKLLPQLQKQSSRKIKKYQLFKIFYLNNQAKIVKWQVMQDIIEKIQKQGTNWLYFKP
ncbi:glycosyltransferase family 2 protein [Acinetobacter sp. VNH17]|uniref:Glycosyltransferase family 2 protein n=1 Tax=Acinetobacter thutiue TaxID=2998078 RepID=A0ABT7WSN0_9GAMM|nr:glycosyltransferase family 2 protein [Acinetobacter thutiue]MCY6413592.1 glycosyltransferase family 2 protein [Acinetobacter thutiue]MDN0015701.1 glycosyltransferase family 2 protein [Acinetobacter thutiue]